MAVTGAQCEPTSASVQTPRLELSRCILSKLLYGLYKTSFALGSHRMMRSVLRATLKLEGGEFYSLTARKMMLDYHQIEVGAYSYGCFDDIRFPGGIRVGRYVSIARSVRSYRRNHPLSNLSTHPLLFGRGCGTETHQHPPVIELSIGDDAWIGAHVTILPGCRRIGVGAVVGAGSVVTRDVEPYSIVAGNPAKIVSYRFDPDTIERLLNSHWWENTSLHLQQEIDSLEKKIIYNKIMDASNAH
jgi:acetyltransferase-like isoleucine patch superfamily enzyme